MIENRLYFIRDTTFDEGRSQVRTGHGPESMATLHNLAINKLREHGNTSIAAGLREMSYEPFTRPHDLLDVAPVTSTNTNIKGLWNSPTKVRTTTESRSARTSTQPGH